MTFHLKPLFNTASKTAVVYFSLSVFSLFLSLFLLIGILAAPVTLALVLLSCIFAPSYFSDPFADKTPSPHLNSAFLSVASCFLLSMAFSALLAHVSVNPWGQMAILFTGGFVSLAMIATKLRGDPDWIVGGAVICFSILLALMFFILTDYLLEQPYSQMLSPTLKSASIWLFLTAAFGAAFFLGASLLHGDGLRTLNTALYVFFMALPGLFAPQHMTAFLTVTTALAILAAITHLFWEEEHFGKLFVHNIRRTTQQEYTQARAMTHISLLKAFQELDINPYEGTFTLSHTSPARWYEAPRWNLSWSQSYQHRNFYQVTSKIANLLTQAFQNNVDENHNQTEFSIPNTRHGQMAILAQASQEQIALTQTLTFDAVKT